MIKSIKTIEQICNGHKITVSREGVITCEPLTGVPPITIDKLMLPISFWTNLSTLINNNSSINAMLTLIIEKQKEQTDSVTPLEEKKTYVKMTGTEKKRIFISGFTAGQKKVDSTSI